MNPFLHHRRHEVKIGTKSLMYDDNADQGGIFFGSHFFRYDKIDHCYRGAVFDSGDASDRAHLLVCNVGPKVCSEVAVSEQRNQVGSSTKISGNGGCMVSGETGTGTIGENLGIGSMGTSKLGTVRRVYWR